MLVAKYLAVNVALLLCCYFGFLFSRYFSMSPVINGTCPPLPKGMWVLCSLLWLWKLRQGRKGGEARLGICPFVTLLLCKLEKSRRITITCDHSEAGILFYFCQILWEICFAAMYSFWSQSGQGFLQRLLHFFDIKCLLWGRHPWVPDIGLISEYFNV